MTDTANRPRRRTVAAALASLTAAALLAGCGSSDDNADPLEPAAVPEGKVVVGSNNFPESILLAYLYGEALKAKGLDVTYKHNIGSRETTYGMLKNGTVTVMPEYNGALLAYLDPKAVAKTAQGTTAAVTAQLPSHLAVLKSASAENKDAVAVNAETAEKYDLTAESSIADLADVAPELVIGGSPEFQSRQQGLVGLKELYGLNFKSFKGLDAGGALTIAALKKNNIQAADVFTTDPSIEKEKFVVLKDTKNLFAFENVTPLIRKADVPKAGQDVLDTLSAKLDTPELMELDAQVQYEHKDALAVARAWLTSKSLL
ncbi:ABC transporter substrate-binding protein [Streptomyces sp. NBC_01317]|uniref:ABC transporter substrate-binding protein n=1 Tax=Streptomyces sp. NBC_01317 TaxID=2903822 RepID=UPI002E0E4DFE|nr:ABC transporter substrate-binding protein [Streptomyces sp. NBC_01317]